jgi:hypothetical protein
MNKLPNPPALQSVRELFTDQQIQAAQDSAGISPQQWRAMTNAEQVAMCRAFNPASNSAHTPGQWSVGARLNDGSLPVMDAGPECECFVALVPPNSTDGGKTSHQQANARLIASAPELLEMLTDARGQLVDLNQSENDGGAFLARLDSLILKATA